MAVKIRLMRMGKKKQPSYRVVVADSRSPRDGRIIELIGRYDPRQDPSVIEIDTERARYWLGNGAQPTERAQKLLEIAGAVAQSKTRGGVYRLETPDVAAEEAPAADAAAEAASEEAPEVEEAAEETPASEEAPAAEETAAQPLAETGEAAEAADETEGDES